MQLTIIKISSAYISYQPSSGFQDSNDVEVIFIINSTLVCSYLASYISGNSDIVKLWQILTQKIFNEMNFDIAQDCKAPLILFLKFRYIC